MKKLNKTKKLKKQIKGQYNRVEAQKIGAFKANGNAGHESEARYRQQKLANGNFADSIENVSIQRFSKTTFFAGAENRQLPSDPNVET